jgi:DNA-directed RNA polymerase specialized sigma24 family protein
MTRWRNAGHYDENEVQALIDNYLELRYMKHRPSLHVRLMDLEVAMRRLPRKLFEPVLVYGLLRFTERAAGEVLAISGREVRRRYRQGFEQIMLTLNGEE